MGLPQLGKILAVIEGRTEEDKLLKCHGLYPTAAEREATEAFMSGGLSVRISADDVTRRIEMARTLIEEGRWTMRLCAYGSYTAEKWYPNRRNARVS